MMFNENIWQTGAIDLEVETESDPAVIRRNTRGGWKEKWKGSSAKIQKRREAPG